MLLQKNKIMQWTKFFTAQNDWYDINLNTEQKHAYNAAMK